MHAQRADRLGNVQMWGIVGAQQEAAYAADRVVVTVEQIVEEDVIRADPNRTILPAHAVDAVVECPGGAHPSYAQGHYDRDNAFYREWTPISADRALLLAWLDEWVYGVPDRAEYSARMGADRWRSVAVGERPSGSVDYGRRLGPDEGREPVLR